MLFRSKGCTKVGVCGKSADLANMQDLLIYVTKGLSEVTTRLRNEGKEVSKEVNHYITLNLFTTITNANFDDDIFYARVKETLAMKNELMNQGQPQEVQLGNEKVLSYKNLKLDLQSHKAFCESQQ